MSPLAKRNDKKGIKLSGGKTELFLLLLLAALFVVFSVASPVFFQFSSLMSLLRQTAIYGIIALGMVFVIASSGIDLSVGSVVGFSGVICAMCLVNGMPMPLAFLVTLLASALIGLLKGILIYNGKVPPFIATLGTQTIVRNLIMLITGAKMISSLPKSFTAIAQATILGVPVLAIVWLLFTLLAFFIIRKTVFGRSIFAYGSNKEAARLSGINVRFTLYGVYIFSAIMCAVAGILMTSRLSNAAPTAGNGYEVDAIAAAVVGGASLDGGEGSIIGTFLGAMIMSTLRQGGTLLGINSFIMEIIVSSLIVIAVLLDKLRKK